MAVCKKNILRRRMAMKMIKKWIACLMAVGMMLSLTACGVSGDQVAVNKPQQKDPDAKKRIAVSMPTKDLQRWAQDGSNMKAQLEKQGYDVDIQYANNDIATQVSQIENMIAVNPDVLVVASIDGSALGTALQGAKGLGIPVISYDRRIMQSDAVSYYATFDNELVGELQGQYIEDKLDLKNAKGPFNIELFTGSSDDNNCNYFFGGAMKILQPYIDSGKLVVRSGSTTLAECATANWSTEEAQKRMENILAAYYQDGTKLDAVLSSNDSVANGITNALVASYKGDFPILTGQDCDITSVKNIIAGKQSMSIFKDTRQLASKVVEMVTAIIEGKEVPVNDTESYDNGKGIVPTYLCQPVFADQDNYKEVLIDSGYYSEKDVK